MNADASLSDLVRKSLPRPRPDEDWHVEIVDDIACATADRSGRPVVRVHRAWRETIYHPGLAHVTCRYPLAIEPIENQDAPLSVSVQKLTMWRGTAINRVYLRGRFTGGLRLVPVFIARTQDGLGLYAHHIAGYAAKAALTERRSKLIQQELKNRHVAALRNNVHQILRERIQSARDYAGDYQVALAPYKTLLPLAEFLARSSDTGPLIVIEKECVFAVLHMQWDDVLKLFHQLALDITAARASFAAPTAEDEPALRLAGST